MKIYLNVPYSEHELARKRGAIWNPARRTWYVEDKTNLWPFLRWMSDDQKKPFHAILPELQKPARHERPDGKKTGKYAAKKRRQAEYRSLRTAMKEARSSSPISN